MTRFDIGKYYRNVYTRRNEIYMMPIMLKNFVPNPPFDRIVQNFVQNTYTMLFNWEQYQLHVAYVFQNFLRNKMQKEFFAFACLNKKHISWKYNDGSDTDHNCHSIHNIRTVHRHKIKIIFQRKIVQKIALN